MNPFLRKHKFLNLFQEVVKKKKKICDDQHRREQTSFKELLRPQKAFGSDYCHSAFLQMLTEQIILTLCQVFQSTEKDGKQSNLFCKSSTALGTNLKKKMDVAEK